MFDYGIYSLKQEEKERLLLKRINLLTEHHYNNCLQYRNIIDNLYIKRIFNNIIDVPYFPVALFKKYDLLSVDRNKIVRTLTSSGTTGQQVSRIFLDNETAILQSKALIKIMSEVLGTRRMPMIVIDSKNVLKNKEMSARAAGIVGIMNFGSRPFFALNEDMSLDVVGLKEFLKRNGNSKFFIFGFTFMVWYYFYNQIENLDLSNGILIHGGGWKKMLDRQVDNVIFKQSLKEKTGLSRIYNFYGMAEQVGSVYLEGDDGLLYCPCFSDIIIRDMKTMMPTENGKSGIIQVISCLPKSYPGHSLLTEDIGVIHYIDKKDSCGRLGKAFSIVGRIPKAEIRGCSDANKTI